MPLFERLLNTRMENDIQRADVAASFVKTLVTGLADHACEYADATGRRRIGLTGGVSFSAPITTWVKETVESNGLEFVGHERISNGDGGISTGQNAIAGSLLN